MAVHPERNAGGKHSWAPPPKTHWERGNMKSLIPTVLLFLIAPVVTSAQSTQNPAVQDRAQGYLFFGMGVLSEAPAHYGIFHTGGGADIRVLPGLAIDSELGVMGRLGDGVGLFSIGPSYHFLGAPHKSKLEPFVDGGYTR